MTNTIRNLWLLPLLLMPAVSAQADQSIAFISDLNGSYGSTAYSPRVDTAVEKITSLKPDLVMITGDMVAGQQQPRLDADWLDQMWAGFNLTVSDPLRHAGIPLAVTVGNHDGSAYPQFELEQQRFARQWEDRKPEIEFLPGSEWPRRYAARLDNILILAFDGTQTGRVPAQERQFVETMLREYGNNAEVTIVMSHLPMWPLARGREREILNDAEFLDVLHRYGVDVYASGHHHAFFAGLDDAGMLHLAIGALGGNARAYSSNGQTLSHSFALLEISDNLMQVRAFKAPGFEQTVPLQDLPETVTGPLGTLQRLDAGAPLRP